METKTLKAEELRISNYVTIKGKVSTVTPGNIFGIKGSKITAQAIPLDKNWLEWYNFSSEGYKSGFTGKDFKSGTTTLDFVLDEPFSKGDWQDYYLFDLGQHRFVPVYYVHQLQNLYFAITQQELEVG